MKILRYLYDHLSIPKSKGFKTPCAAPRNDSRRYYFLRLNLLVLREMAEHLGLLGANYVVRAVSESPITIVRSDGQTTRLH